MKNQRQDKTSRDVMFSSVFLLLQVSSAHDTRTLASENHITHATSLELRCFHASVYPSLSQSPTGSGVLINVLLPASQGEKLDMQGLSLSAG